MSIERSDSTALRTETMVSIGALLPNAVTALPQGFRLACNRTCRTLRVRSMLGDAIFQGVYHAQLLVLISAAAQCSVHCIW